MKKLGMVSGLSGLSGWSVAGGYIGKVLSIAPANLLAYWPLNEIAGAVADNATGLAARDGAYTGVTLADAIGPDGMNYAPLFDGANDRVNIFTESLAAAYNQRLGSAAIWAKVANVGVWTDGAVRRILTLGGWWDGAIWSTQDIQKYLDNDLVFERLVGDGSSDWCATTTINAAWIHVAATWNEAGQAILYLNGVAVSIDPTPVVLNAGGLSANHLNIGAYDNVPTEVWSGWLAHSAIWDVVLTPAQILELATV